MIESAQPAAPASPSTLAWCEPDHVLLLQPQQQQQEAAPCCLHPGDVYFYAANSYVTCIQRGGRHKVTPKSPGLNPNANVFQSKSPVTQEPSSTTAWEDVDNAETTPTTNEEFSYINGDVSLVQPSGGVSYPPTPESPEHMSTDYQNMNGVNVEVLFTPQDSAPVVADEPATTLESGNVEESQLKAMLKNQLEYYFSRENLANDSYLVSQMDADQYVPIATVANFNQVKRLTADMDLVVSVLRDSANVQVDEKGEKVRPLHKRCIVILREIPDTTPLKDVKDLFAGENCPKFISCEFAHNNSWYVTFDSDEDAQRAYQYLREEVRCFLGKPIMARIKAKPLIRTSFVPKNGFKQQQQQQQQQQFSADTYNQQQPQQQLTPAVVAASPQQQQQSAPQQQQQQQQYPFSTHIPPAMPYMNGHQQQAYPFFPPNTVTHMWPNAPYFDPGMVFAANGYTAGTIKLNNAAGARHGFQNMRNRNQNKGSHRGNIERRGSFGDRSSVHVERHSSLGSSRSSPRNSDMPSAISRGRSSSETGAAISSSGVHSHHHHHHAASHNAALHSEVSSLANSSSSSSSSAAANMSAAPAMMAGHTSMPAAGASHVSSGGATSQPNTQHARQNNGTDLAGSSIAGNKDHSSQSQRRNTNFRSRRRREDEGAKISRPGTQPVSAKDPKALSAESPKFDLEPTSFPPLPGSSNNTTAGDVFENKMSDVVKGTAKPLTRECKAPPPVTQPPPPPSSPVKETPPTSVTTPPPPAASSIPTPPPTPQKVSKPCAVVSDSATKSTEAAPPPAAVTAATTTPVPQPVEEKQPPPVKLSYAQMAQRAKERADGGNTAVTATTTAATSATPTSTTTTSSGNSKESTPSGQTSATTSGKSQALREQTQTVKAQTACMQSPVRDLPPRKDLDPKDMRHNPARRAAKENREWRESRDKDIRVDRMDRGDRRRGEREIPRAK